MSTTGIDGRGAIPQTTTELNELAAAGGQLGISQENIIDFTEVMAQMGTATNLVGEEGAATLARFQNVMGVGQKTKSVISVVQSSIWVTTVRQQNQRLRQWHCVWVNTVHLYECQRRTCWVILPHCPHWELRHKWAVVR